MNNLFKEIYRLKIPIALCIVGAWYWGWAVALSTASLFLFVLGIGMIFGHLIPKELFGKYKWDIGKKLNIAWENNLTTPKDAILAVGMLLARVLIYITIIIAMALLGLALMFKNSSAYQVPDRAVKLFPILIEEHQRIWPESDIFKEAGKITQEGNWKEKAKRVEPNKVTSYGLMQVCDKTFIEMRRYNKTLADIEPVMMLQARYSIRIGLLLEKGLWRQATCRQTDEIRWWWVLRAYNGGSYLLNKEIDRAGGCYPELVDKQCKRNIYHYKWGDLDLCKVNTDYPKQVIKYAEVFRMRMK